MDNIRLALPFFYREEKFMFWVQLMIRMKAHRHIAEIVKNHIYYKYHCEISPHATIDKTARFPHPIGIVIGGSSVVGGGTVIFQNVTLGVNIVDGKECYPVIEENCKIYPNSVVMGNVTVRKGTYIGAGSVVTKSTCEYGVYHGESARYIKQRK